MDAKMLKALSDPKRYMLLTFMCERAYCVGALARKSLLSESAVSQHLKVLREAGLVLGVKRGSYTHYSVDKAALAEVIAELEKLRNMQPEPCEGPFTGCSEAESIKCKAFAPGEK